MQAKLKELLSSAPVLLAAISGFGYVCALLFEIGYLNFFGINYQAAHVTTESFVFAGLAALAGVFIILPYRNIVSLLWIPIEGGPLKNFLVKKLRIGIALAIFLLPLAAYWGVWEKIYGILPAYLLVTMLIDLVIDGKGVKGLQHKARASLSAPLPRTVEQDMPILIILLMAILVCFVSLMAGKTFAFTRDSYQVIDGSNNIIVREYGDQFIVARYDPKTDTLIGNHSYVHTSDKDVDFHVVSIHRLRKQ